MHKLWEDEQLKKICSWERLVQTTYRAWGAGTNDLDTTRGTGVDSDEEEAAVCTTCREKCRQVQGEQAPQAEAGSSAAPNMLCLSETKSSAAGGRNV
jgi:hypothetical protein